MEDPLASLQISFGKKATEQGCCKAYAPLGVDMWKVHLSQRHCCFCFTFVIFNITARNNKVSECSILLSQQSLSLVNHTSFSFHYSAWIWPDLCILTKAIIQFSIGFWITCTSCFWFFSAADDLPCKLISFFGKYYKYILISWWNRKTTMRALSMCHSESFWVSGSDRTWVFIDTQCQFYHTHQFL